MTDTGRLSADAAGYYSGRLLLCMVDAEEEKSGLIQLRFPRNTEGVLFASLHNIGQ